MANKSNYFPRRSSHFKNYKVILSGRGSQGNEYRITCLDPDEIYYSLDKKVIVTPRTPDVFDIEISSIQLKQESDSIKQYYIKGFVSNIVSNGTTFSDVENGINNTSIINLIIGKNIVELTFAGHNISSTRKK